MSEPDAQAAKLAKRKEILDELWALVVDEAHPGSVAVAALDRIARIEDAYSPIKIETKKKFANLADFYAGVGAGSDVAAEVESEKPGGQETPVFEPTAAKLGLVDEDDEDGFL